LIVTSADPIRPKLSQGGAVPCIGYMRSIAIQGTALDYGKPFIIKITILPIFTQKSYINIQNGNE